MLMTSAACAPTHPPAGPRAHLVSLTSLRFFAALHVVIFHEAQLLLADGPARRFAANGYLGVSFFYVLSGFILAYTYLEPVDVGPIDRAKFWRARFARVYPVYLLALVVSLPVFVPWAIGKFTAPGVTEPAKALVTGVANVALLQAWLPQTVAPWNSPGWSLSVEAFFYLLFPVVAVAMSRRSNRTLGMLVGGVWLVSMVVPLAFLALHPATWNGDQPGTTSTGLMFLKFFPVQHLAEFLIGTGCGIFFLRRRAGGRAPLRAPATISIVASCALLAILAAPWQLPYPLLHSGALAPLFALLILALASDRGPLVGALRSPTLELLGKASYAVYLLHEPIAAILYKSPWSPFRVADPRPRFLLYLLVVIGVSVVVLQWYEEPARQWLRARARRTERARSLAGHVGIPPVSADNPG